MGVTLHWSWRYGLNNCVRRSDNGPPCLAGCSTIPSYLSGKPGREGIQGLEVPARGEEVGEILVGGQANQLAVGAKGEPVRSGGQREVVAQLQDFLFEAVTYTERVAPGPEITRAGTHEDQREVSGPAGLPEPGPGEKQVVGKSPPECRRPRPGE